MKQENIKQYHWEIKKKKLSQLNKKSQQNLVRTENYNCVNQKQ